MRILFVIMIFAFSVTSSTPAKAMACGSAASVGAITSVLSEIPDAIKTFGFMEDIYLSCGSSGCKWKFKCRSTAFLKNLEKGLKAFCSIIDGLEGSPLAVPVVSAINGKLMNIKTNLSSLSGIESSITDEMALMAYVDNKMLSINSSMLDIQSLMPNVNTGVTNTVKLKLKNKYISYCVQGAYAY